MATVTIVFDRRHVPAGEKNRQILIKATLSIEEARWLKNLWQHGGDRISVMQIETKKVRVNFKGVKKPKGKR